MFKKVRHLLEKNFTTLILYLFYFLGIGPSAILAKIFAKTFLQTNLSKKSTHQQNSNWHYKNLTYPSNLEKMY